jgi:acyl-CoA thioester hydrolase
MRSMSVPTIDLTDAAVYRHWTTDTIRFSDQDAAGHTNNVAIAAYCETGRLAYAYEILLPDKEPGESFILARITIDYRRESRWPGSVRIGTAPVSVGNTSATLGSGVFCNDICIATAEAIVVFRRDDRPAPIPERIRARLADRG